MSWNRLKVPSTLSTVTVSELNLQNDKQLTSPPNDSISDLSFSPQADFLSVASWDNKVRIYEISSQADSQGRAIIEHSAPVLSSAWFPDGSKLASGGCDNTVKVFDIQSGQSVQIGTHDAPVSSVRVVNLPNAGGPLVFSASWDKTIRYWDSRQQQPICTIQLPERAYSMDSKQNLLVIATSNRQICLVNLSNPTQIAQTISSPLKWQTRVVSCHSDGRGYAIGSIEGRCAIQYVEEIAGKKSFSFRCHREEVPPRKETTMIYPVNDISFHPIYGTFSTAGSDGTIQFWDKDNQCRLKYSSSLGGTISATAFNRNGQIFAYAVSYDWSKGYQFNTTNYPVMVKLHSTADSEIQPRPKN